MRIGLLGGTFDPIHLGHLRAAESAREQLDLELLLVVPAGVPPHRREPLASPSDRFAMVALATQGHPAFVVSDLELRREGPSYSVDTVSALLAERPGSSVVLIVGSDALADLKTWRDVSRLRSLCRVAVVPRPGDTRPQADVADVLHVDGPGLPVSGSAVRRRVAEGRSIRYLVPDAVADYIAKRGLYR